MILTSPGNAPSGRSVTAGQLTFVEIPSGQPTKDHQISVQGLAVLHTSTKLDLAEKSIAAKTDDTSMVLCDGRFVSPDHNFR